VQNALASLETAVGVGLQQAVPSVDATLRALDEYLTRQTGMITGGGAQQ
jgi:hypothetical protein